MKKVAYYQELGKTIFRKIKNSRSIKIRIKAGNTLLITLPSFISYQEAEDFLFTQKDTLIKELKKNEVLVFKDNYQAFFKKLKIVLNFSDAEILRFEDQNEYYQLSIFSKHELNDPLIQEIISGEVIKLLKKEALIYLNSRVNLLAQKYNLNYGKIKINQATGRWGSCNHKNDLNFSFHTIRLPLALIDYIITHELCHTIHKNHQKKFHQLQEKLLPNAKYLSNELKKYRTNELKVYS